MYKLYRHKLYRHKLYRHKLYRAQIVSGTNDIGHKLYWLQFVSDTNCIVSLSFFERLKQNGSIVSGLSLSSLWLSCLWTPSWMCSTTMFWSILWCTRKRRLSWSLPRDPGPGGLRGEDLGGLSAAAQQAADNQPPPPLFPIKLWNMYETILANEEITNNHVEGMKDL